MDSSSIVLAGSDVESVVQQEDRIEVRFSRAYIVKTMTGSTERTRWWQAGSLIFEGAQPTEALPDFPAVCDGGDVGENVYTYRDMIPIPLESRGRAHCDLRFEGQPQHLRIEAKAVRLEMVDRPRYIEHIRSE